MNIQLLQDCADPEPLFHSPLWCAEVKLDGDWRRVIKGGNEVIGLTREGNRVAPGGETVALAMLSPFDFVLDGEQMSGGRFVAFDIFGLMGSPVISDNSARRDILRDVWKGEVVERVIGEEAKRELCERVKASGGEGIVFKRVDAPYIEGRTPYCQRWKNYETDVFEVSAVNIAKCSIEVSRHGVSFGGVPVQSLARLPKVGDKILVKYERVTEKNKLLRAVLAK
jgi:bifunctional non-homologous end joining protein LigD